METSRSTQSGWGGAKASRRARSPPLAAMTVNSSFSVSRRIRRFSGASSTIVDDELWPLLNAVDNLRYLIIETAFSNEEEALATLSRHLCPTLLHAELAKLNRDAEVYITHLKPGQIERIMREIDACEAIGGRFKPQLLQNNQLFEF